MREVTIQQLYKDIEATPGSRGGHQRTAVEHRKDPVVELTKPLKQYEGYVFFYAGLLYGFCRLDSSIPERFRAQTGARLKTYQHVVSAPLLSIPWFPEFSKTRVAHLLQSAEMGPEQENLFDFISSQLIVDRRKGVVWKVKAALVKLPDPYMTGAKEVPMASEIVVFSPYQHDVGFEVMQRTSMFVETPEVLKTCRTDAEFAKLTKESLA